ncbi:hypothetical protein BDB01DRAFT_749655 [Pilobolus umbonatus]|nr:hypothetical protein BDB01DRAFT_749655 [Pilobolus umbonatus]
MKEETPKKQGNRANKYNDYGPSAKESFFFFKQQQLMSIRAAAIKANVKESTARGWWAAYQRNPSDYVIAKKTNRENRPSSALQDDHKKHLINFFDNNPQAFIQDAVEDLTSNFAGLSIKKSRVHEFMRDECNLSIKKSTMWSEARLNSDTIRMRYEWVEKWLGSDMDFSSNCIFNDESGFNINLKASRAWSSKGKDAVLTTPLTRAPSHTIIGAISAVGVINISIRVPKAPPKERLQTIM